jgi:hypothetical protein
MKPVRIAVLLLLFASLAPVNDALAEWKIKQAEIKWGYPDWAKVVDAESSTRKAMDEYPHLFNREMRTMDALYENAHAESHKPDGNRQEDLEALTLRYFADIARQYSDAGFPEPDYLPTNDSGTAYMIYIYDFALSNFDRLRLQLDTSTVGARVTPPCTKSDYLRGKKGLYAFNTPYLYPIGKQMDRDHRIYLYNTIAHELFHAVQNKSEILAGNNACKSAHAWSEGTATAVGTWMADNYEPFKGIFPGKLNPVSTEGHYDFPFDWTKLTGKNAGKNGHGGSHNAYAFNPMFRFAMERKAFFSTRDPGLDAANVFLEDLGTMKNIPGLHSDERQARWWDVRLFQNTDGNMSLRTYFMEMLAHHADSSDRYSLSEQDWVDALFDGCADVTLARDGSWVATEKSYLNQNAALCFDVTVEDLKPGQCFEVFANARSSMAESQGEARTVIENLHMSVPAMGARVRRNGWETYDCKTMSSSGNTRTCVADPMTVTTEEASDDESDVKLEAMPRKTTPADGGDAATTHWYRTWRMARQQATGGSATNRYIVGLIAGYATSLNSDTYTVDVTFGTTLTNEFEIDGSKGPDCSESGTLGSFGTGTPHPAVGDPRALVADIRQGPFFTWLPDYRGMDGFSDEGMSIFQVADYNLDTEENAMQGRSQFIIGVEPQIPFGATGRFPAWTGGHRLGTNLAFYQNIGDDPSGYVEVVRFDNEVLHVKVGGRYCIFEPGDDECRGEHTMSAEIVRPFGWTYDRAQIPTAVFTEDMEEYARQNETVMRGAGLGLTLGGPFGPSGGSGGGGPSSGPGTGGGGAGQQPCACSCDELVEISKTMDLIGDADLFGEDAPPLPDGVEPTDVVRAMQCSMQCVQNYMRCDEARDMEW